MGPVIGSPLTITRDPNRSSAATIYEYVQQLPVTKLVQELKIARGAMYQEIQFQRLNVFSEGAKQFKYVDYTGTICTTLCKLGDNVA